MDYMSKNANKRLFELRYRKRFHGFEFSKSEAGYCV